MNAEILCVGTELLLGDVVNTSATYISKKLSQKAINVYCHIVIGDNKQRLCDAIRDCLTRTDLLLITGGLGATYDDITKEATAEVLGRKLIFNDDVLKSIESYFQSQGRVMTENCKKQAFIPDGAIIIENKKGTAPGLILEVNNKAVILMPGVPAEMKFLMDNAVMDYIDKLSDELLFSCNINFFGIGESALEQKLKDIMEKSINPTVAPYAKTGEVVIRLTAKAKTEEDAEKIIEPIKHELYNRASDYIYGENVPNLETVLVERLTELNKKIAVAESCTGGLIAKRITDISGASRVFECGVCSYSDRIKNKILNVNSETLKDYTAVSMQTAKEMATGVRKLSGADIAISTTGVAGPGDLSETQPCGLVFVGIDSEHGSKVLELHLGGEKRDRSQIRYIAASWAMAECLKLLKK